MLTSKMSDLLTHAQSLVNDLASLEFPAPVAVTYNPLTYAWENHAQYLERYGAGRKDVLFLGMNPGPWGMSQTGVPFGEISAVRDWMQLDGTIRKPDVEHPKRPVEGYDCPRTEVSGQRLWGYIRECFPLAEAFFSSHFVLNYCPLVWMSETGANITPDKLSKATMAPIEEACMRHLQEVITVQRPAYLIGVGAYAEKRLLQAQRELGATDVTVAKILHPSPASPAANRGWAEAASKQLTEIGISWS